MAGDFGEEGLVCNEAWVGGIYSAQLPINPSDMFMLMYVIMHWIWREID